MRDGTTRSVAKRAAAILAAASLVLTAFILSPAGAHFKPKIGHIVKHVRKKLTPRFDTRYIQETELVRWGPIKLNVGSADQTIGTFGPFTLKAQCLDSDATADVDINTRVGITTTETNSALNQYYGFTDHDFDPGEDGDWLDDTPSAANDDPGDPQEMGTFGDGFAYAIAPSGASLWGETNALTNFAGSHCVLKGFVLVNA